MHNCIWRRYDGEYNYHTDCGHTYFTYIKDANPKIIANKCPWCDNEIRRVDYDEDED